MFKEFKRLVCLLLLCFFCNALLASIAVPFELINGLIIVEAEVDGKLGNYIIDSGSNGILLNGNSTQSDVSYQTLNSIIEGSETIINSFRVGDFEVVELLGFSTDLSNLEVYLSKSVAGILGWSIFTPNSMIFDFENSTLIISEVGISNVDIDGLNSLSFSIIEDLPVVQLEIGGNMVAFILDSGASSHFFDFDFLKLGKNELVTTGIERDIVTAGGQAEKSLEYELFNCKIGQVETAITAFDKDFELISKTLGMKISGLLSLSKLTSGKVHFDLKAQKVFYN